MPFMKDCRLSKTFVLKPLSLPDVDSMENAKDRLKRIPDWEKLCRSR